MTRKMTHKLDKFEFGRHKGKTVREVIEKDPSYILWLVEENAVEFPQEFIDSAEDNILDSAMDNQFRWDDEG